MYTQKDYDKVMDRLVEIGKRFAGQLTFVDNTAMYLRAKDGYEPNINILVASDKVRKEFIKAIQDKPDMPLHGFEMGYECSGEYGWDSLLATMSCEQADDADIINIQVGIAEKDDDLTELIQTPEEYIYSCVRYCFVIMMEGDDDELESDIHDILVELDDFSKYLKSIRVDYDAISEKLYKRGIAKSIVSALVMAVENSESYDSIDVCDALDIISSLAE